MRVFVTKSFRRFQRKERLSDAVLLEAIARAERGLIDADLGSNLIKQRVARPGEGRSGGYRTILVVRLRDRAAFLYGFAKSKRDNIDDTELEGLAKVGAFLLSLDEKEIEKALVAGELLEIDDDGEA